MGDLKVKGNLTGSYGMSTKTQVGSEIVSEKLKTWKKGAAVQAGTTGKELCISGFEVKDEAIGQV